MVGLLAAAWLYALFTMRRREEPAADKDIFAAFGVTVAAVIAAALSGPISFADSAFDAVIGGSGSAGAHLHLPARLALLGGFAYGFALVLAKSVLLDLRDIAGDHLVGDRTWPVRIGRTWARRLVAGLFAALVLGPTLLEWGGVWPGRSWLMGSSGLAGLYLLSRIERVRADRHARWLADGLLVIPGLAAFAMN